MQCFDIIYYVTNKKKIHSLLCRLKVNNVTEKSNMYLSLAQWTVWLWTPIQYFPFLHFPISFSLHPFISHSIQLSVPSSLNPFYSASLHSYLHPYIFPSLHLYITHHSFTSTFHPFISLSIYLSIISPPHFFIFPSPPLVYSSLCPSVHHSRLTVSPYLYQKKFLTHHSLHSLPAAILPPIHVSINFCLFSSLQHPFIYKSNS